MENSKKVLIGAGGIGVTGLGILSYLGDIDPDSIGHFVSATASSQIAQAGFFFTLAAFIHSGRVRKEIASNFQALTAAITQLGNNLATQMEAHSERLDKLERKVFPQEETKPGG